MQSSLDSKKSLGVDPIAGTNVAQVGPCCLDINTKAADFAKGRFRWVWWSVWLCFGLPLLIACVSLTQLFSENPDVSGVIGAGVGTAFLVIGMFVPMMGIFIYIWRTRLPVRFSRKDRKVYLFHRGQVYVSGWDTIRAYIYLQDVVLPNGVVDRDGVVHLEFSRGDGKPLTIALLGTESHPVSLYEGAAGLWEYIRVYMEEGPEALPDPVTPDTGPENADIRYWARHHSPFPIFRRKSFWGVVSTPFALPVRVAIFLTSFPTDIIYSTIEGRVKLRPWPAEIEQACRCEESSHERSERVASLLGRYDREIEYNENALAHIEDSLDEDYQRTFVEPCSGQHGLHKTPEGWYQVKLTDVVEVNPRYNVRTGKEVRYATVSGVAESRLLLRPGKLEYKRTSVSSTMFRNGDVLFPLVSPWLEKETAVIADCLHSSELGGCEQGLIVMRGRAGGPAFTYCLAKDLRLRKYILRGGQGEESEGDASKILTSFSFPMPPPTVLEAFEERFEYLIASASHLASANERLRKKRSRVVANAAG